MKCGLLRKRWGCRAVSGGITGRLRFAGARPGHEHEGDDGDREPPGSAHGPSGVLRRGELGHFERGGLGPRAGHVECGDRARWEIARLACQPGWSG